MGPYSLPYLLGDPLALIALLLAAFVLVALANVWVPALRGWLKRRLRSSTP